LKLLILIFIVLNILFSIIWIIFMNIPDLNYCSLLTQSHYLFRLVPCFAIDHPILSVELHNQDLLSPLFFGYNCQISSSSHGIHSFTLISNASGLINFISLSVFHRSCIIFVFKLSLGYPFTIVYNVETLHTLFMQVNFNIFSSPLKCVF
jgi:hypothetical protein